MLPTKYSLIITTLLCLVTTYVSAGRFSDNELRGPEFTNPDIPFDMPEEWQNQPIKYSDWANKADLAVSLDQFLYPFMLPAIEKYAQENKVNIAVQEGTCGTSAKALKNKEADIAGFCCPAAETDRFIGLKFHTVGIASLALLTHPSNKITDVTYDEAQKIFRGDIYRWSELKTAEGKKGAKRPIRVIGRPHCKLRPGHWRLLLKNEDEFSPRMQEVSAIEDMMSEVAKTEDAVGYETLWSLKQHPQQKVSTLAINGIKPSESEKIASGEYPIYRVYNVTTWEADNTKSEAAQKLVTYLIEQMEFIDPKYGVVPVSKLRKTGWQFKDNELIGEPDVKK